MIGIIFIAIAQFFAEISTSIGKYEVAHKKESLYAMGFLSGIWISLFLVIIGITRDNLIFSFESLPTFLLRAVLEIILLFVSLNAVIAADRSTFSFLRTLTIPLLLVSDIALGYAISTTQILGIGLIVVAFVFLFLNHGLSRRGKLLSLFSALLAVATLTLYKYDITHYNSVEAEEGLIHLILLVVIIVAAKVQTNENVFKYLFHRTFFIQSLVAGIAGVFLSFAYSFAPASIISAAKRGFEVLAALLSGRAFFREKHFVVKMIAFALIVVGVGLTVA